MMSLEELQHLFQSLQAQVSINSDALIDVVIHRYSLTLMDALGEILMSEDTQESIVSQLKNILFSNWQFIQGSILCYTAQPNLPAHRLCFAIAHYIQLQLPQAHVLHHLIPDVLVESFYGDYTDIGDDIERVFRTHVLSQNRLFLNPVLLLKEVDLVSGPYGRLMNPYYDNFNEKLSEDDIYLHRQEIDALYQHSDLCRSILDNIVQYQSMVSREDSLLGQLHGLIRGLYINSVHVQGQEFEAGNDVYRLIAKFNEFYRYLSEVQLRKLPEELREEIERLFNLASPTSARRDGAINTCISLRREELLDKVKKHEELLETMTIGNDVRQSLIKQYQERHAALINDLVNGLQQGIYAGQDHKSITLSILEHLNIELHLNEDNLNQIFKSLDLVCIEHYLSKPDFLAQFLGLFHGVSDWVLFLIPLDPEKIKPIFQHVLPHIKGIFSYPRHLYSLLMTLSVEKIERITESLTEIFEYHFFAQPGAIKHQLEDFGHFLDNFESVDRCLAVCRGLNNILQPKIQGIDHLKNLFLLIPSELSRRLVDPLMRLWRLETTNFQDLAWKYSLFTVEQANQQYRLEEPLFKQLIVEPFQANHFFARISKKSVNNALFKQMSVWIPQPKTVEDLLSFMLIFRTNTKISHVMFEKVVDHINWNDGNGSALGELLPMLVMNQLSRIYHQLDIQLPIWTCAEINNVFREIQKYDNTLMMFYNHIEGSLIDKVQQPDDIRALFYGLRIQCVEWKHRTMSLLARRVHEWPIDAMLYQILFHVWNDTPFISTYRQHYWATNPSILLNLHEIITIIECDEAFLNEGELIHRLCASMPIQSTCFWDMLALWKGELPSTLFERLMEWVLDENITDIRIHHVLKVLNPTMSNMVIKALLSHPSPTIFNHRMKSLFDVNCIMKWTSPEELHAFMRIHQAKITGIIRDKFQYYNQYIGRSVDIDEDFQPEFLSELDCDREMVMMTLSQLMTFSQWPLPKYRILMSVNEEFWRELFKIPSILVFYINHLKHHHFIYFIKCASGCISEMPIDGIIEIIKGTLISQKNRMVKLIFPEFALQAHSAEDWGQLIMHLDLIIKEQVIRSYDAQIIASIQTPEQLRDILNLCGIDHFQKIISKIPENFFHHFDEFHAFVIQFSNVHRLMVISFFEYEIFRLGRMGGRIQALGYQQYYQKNEECFHLLRNYLPEQLVLDFIKVICQRKDMLSIKLAFEMLIKAFDKEIFQLQFPIESSSHYLANQLMQLNDNIKLVLFSVFPFPYLHDYTLMKDRLINYIENIQNTNQEENPAKVARHI
jgi:hypothetical protein